MYIYIHIEEMGRLLNLTRFTLLGSTIAASYYYYFIYNDGYYYNRSIFKKVNERVDGIIKDDAPIQTVFHEKIDMLSNKYSRKLLTRSFSETLKDFWNEQVRNSVAWIYSLGK